MPVLSTVTTVTGPPGTGKSCIRGPKFLIEEYLPHFTGTWYGTIPVHPARVAEAAAAHVGKKGDAETLARFRERVKIIPADEVKNWEDGARGPWSFFKDKDLRGCHIALDEAHHYAGKKHKAAHRTRWAEWLQELRHRGDTTCEFISQNTGRLAPEVAGDVAECRVLLSNTEKRYVWGFQRADLYELTAAITRRYAPIIVEEHKVQENEGWKTELTRKVRLDPYYFRFYDSYAGPVDGSAGDAAGGYEGPKRQYEQRTRLGVAWWFVRRNLWVCSLYGAVLAAALYGSVGGGVEKAADASFGAIRDFDPSAGDDEPPASGAPVPAPKPPPVPPPASAKLDAAEFRRREAAFVKKLNQLAADNAALRASLALPPPPPEAEPHPDPGPVVSIGPGRATFAGGQTLTPGDPLHGGPFDGFVLHSVSRGGRAAYLSGGGALVRLPLGRHRGPVPAVPDPLLGHGLRPVPGVVTADLSRPAAEPVRRRPPAADLGGGVQPGDGAVGDVLGPAGGGDGDGGVRGPAGGPGGGADRPAPGDLRHEDGWRVVPRRSEADRRRDARRAAGGHGPGDGGAAPVPVPDRIGAGLGGDGRGGADPGPRTGPRPLPGGAGGTGTGPAPVVVRAAVGDDPHADGGTGTRPRRDAPGRPGGVPRGGDRRRGL